MTQAVPKRPAVIGFDAQLLEALRPGTAPQDLKQSLLRAAGRRPSRWRARSVGLAAAVLLLLGSGAWGWMAGRDRGSEGERFTQAALQNYMEAQRLDFTVDAAAQECAGQCCRWSEGAVGFSAELPRPLAGQPLKGGRASRVAGCRAACFFLRDGRAVYVFDRMLKGLDADPGKAPLMLAAGHQARAWNEDGRGYILVEPPGR